MKQANDTASGTSASSCAGTGADVNVDVTVEDVSVTFHVRRGWKRTLARVRALQNVSFDIPAGQTTALVGESGSGKTTLARTIIGLQKPTSGRVRMGDRVLSGGHGQADPTTVQMVFQDPRGALNPRMTVERIIAEPMEVQGGGAKNQSVRPRSADCWTRWVWHQRTCTDTPKRFLEVNDSVFALPGPWPRHRRWWWPTSPCPPWMSPSARKFSTC